MDAASLARLRWRLSGAWLWPSFFVLTVTDAVIVHDLPLSGDTGLSLVGAWVFSAVISLLAIALLGGLIGRLVRRLRPDMPRVVARNYGGALITLATSFVILAGGLIHHPSVVADRSALKEAVARATEFIGVHAPAVFQENLQELFTVQLLGPVLYRSCVPDRAGDRLYCVIVNVRRPFP
ncbi:MAG TPA: hypothetical protein VG293_11725, partial [Solirubrobacteraceae bacterium]|nr:hypothetical protein [Solirubrobacteraceae bacterium]